MHVGFKTSKIVSNVWIIDSWVTNCFYDKNPFSYPKKIYPEREREREREREFSILIIILCEL
jgi:hypothetical protein